VSFKKVLAEQDMLAMREMHGWCQPIKGTALSYTSGNGVQAK